MKLVFYLFRRFIPIFLGALGFFSLVLILVDLLMNLTNYLQNGASASQVAQVMLLYFPKTCWYAMPLGVLFAVAYTLSDLYACNELTAIFSSGISLLHFTFPLLLFSVIMSFGLYFFENYLVVPTYSKKMQLQGQLLKEEKSLNKNNIVVISDNGHIIYKAKFYENSQKRLSDLYLVIRDENKRLDSIVHADAAVWNSNENHWNLMSAIQYKYEDNTIKTLKLEKELCERLTESYETFQNNVVSIAEVDSHTAKVYISHLRRTGLPFNQELSEYYKKFAFPAIVFIVVFLSIGLSGKSRKNVLLISLSLSVSAAVLFYVLQMVTMLMAKFGYISPFMGAWFPVFLFIIISIVLLHYART
ncbi:MAG: LptF/LptG family permease [Treponema sp.]|nr:LptF/LptG family permease [Treponema sp.]